ncbi:MAG: hypothetical protein ACREMY_24170, partial [bacterium]
MDRKRIFVLTLTFLLFSAAQAQTDYQQQYLNAKQLFREGRYSLAQAAFEPIMLYDPANPFSEYASFYYALSAFKQGFPAVASTSFERLITTYPSWAHLDDVRYWLAVIHFQAGQYFQAMLQLRDIDDRRMEKDDQTLEKKYIPAIDDLTTVGSLNKEYPKDKIIAFHYVQLLSENPTPENEELVNQLVNRYGFERSKLP